MSPPAAAVDTGLATLAALQQRNSRGDLRALTESNVEQSFNEQLFAKLFGYRTLLRDGGAAFHVLPKAYSFSRTELRKYYSDFSLGHFAMERGEIIGNAIASAELKEFGADLDAPQKGNYKGITAVEQAHNTARAASAPWTIVCNFEEMQLYRTGNLSKWETFNFADASPQRLRHAYALFGHDSILGSTETSPPPLERLFQSIQGGRPMLLPSEADRIRISMTCSALGDGPHKPRTTYPLSRLSKSIDLALSHFQTEFAPPKLADDVLEYDHSLARLRITTAGHVVVSEYINNDGLNLKATKIADTAARWLAAALTIYRRLDALAFEAHFSLLDLTPSVSLWLHHCDGWIEPTEHPWPLEDEFHAATSVARVNHTIPEFRVQQTWTPNKLQPYLGELVGDLLFPFEGTRRFDPGARYRARPADILAWNVCDERTKYALTAIPTKWS